MELTELLSNPDYVNANTATRKAIFEKYSKNNKDYVDANAETRQAIHQRFGLGAEYVKEPLPEKITDFTARDVGNMVRQSFSEANQALSQGKPGRTGVVGPALLGAVGETIKGAGAIGELATDKAKGITEVGKAITQGAQEANMPAAMAGQVGSYVAPYKLAQKGIQATAGAVPYLRGAVNPATFLGSTGETAAATGLLAGLTTPGSYDERMAEAQNQAMIGGALNAGVRAAIPVAKAAGGAFGRATGYIAEPGEQPLGWQARSSRNPIGDTFVPPKELANFEQGKLPYGQLPKEAPIGDLANNPIDRAALALSGGNIPTAGQGARAFGERIGDTYKNPLTAAIDIASMFNPVLPGVPLLTAGKAGMGLLQAAADARLANKGFTAGLPQKLEAYKTGQIPMPGIPGPMPAAGSVSPETPQQMAAAQINPAAATTPAAQAAVNKSVSGKIGNSNWNLGANYNLANGTGNVKVQTPLGPINVKFGGNKTTPETTTPQAQPQPMAQPQAQPMAQTTGPIKPTAETSIQKMSSIVGNDPTVLGSASLEEHAKALYNHYKSVGAPIDKRTAKTLAQQELSAYNKAQSDAVAAQQQAAADAKKAADLAAYEASPIGQSVKSTQAQLAENPNLLSDSNIRNVTPENVEKVKRALEPNENTSSIKQALQQKVAENPGLTGFDQPYVIPQSVKQPVETFLKSNFGNSKNLVAVGQGGTGKSSLALQWQRENPDGQLNKITKLNFDADELHHQTKINTNANKQLYLIDEVDQFTPAQLNQLESLINDKTRAKFLFTTNHPENIPKFINEYPTVSLNIKLTPEERSAFALNIAEKFNVNKTPAEIEKIAQDPKLTNFADIKKEISKGYTLKEPPNKDFTFVPQAATKMPDTPKTVTDMLDALSNNELPRNAIIFDRSAAKADPDLRSKIQNYTGPAMDTDVPTLRNLSNRMIGSNSIVHEPPKLIVVSENNAERLQYLKAELEISNDKTNPVNIVFYDPKNLLTSTLPGEATTPMARRAHIIDESHWKSGARSEAKELPDQAKMLREQFGTPEEFIKYMKPSLPANEMDRLLNLAFPEYQTKAAKAAKANPTDNAMNSLFQTPLETPKVNDVAKTIKRGEELGIIKSPKVQAQPKFNSPAEMRRALFGTMPEAELEALIKQQFPPK